MAASMPFPVEVLKYGSLGLAALMGLWSAILLTIELNRKTVRSTARNMIYVFMGFAVVLIALTMTINIMDALAAPRSIRDKVVDIDRMLDEKRLDELDVVKNDIPAQNRFSNYVRNLCAATEEIKEAVGGTDPLPNCQSLLSQPPRPES